MLVACSVSENLWNHSVSTSIFLYFVFVLFFYKEKIDSSLIPGSTGDVTIPAQMKQPQKKVWICNSDTGIIKILEGLCGPFNPAKVEPRQDTGTCRKIVLTRAKMYHFYTRKSSRWWSFPILMGFKNYIS